MTHKVFFKYLLIGFAFVALAFKKTGVIEDRVYLYRIHGYMEIIYDSYMVLMQNKMNFSPTSFGLEAGIRES